MLSICKELFSRWNIDVRYCHWKSTEHLMKGLDGGTDLDLFVLPIDRRIAEKHLVDCKFIKFQPQKSNRYPMVDEWIGFDEEKGNLVHVHLHYQIITGKQYCKEYIFPIDELIIASRIIDEKTNIYIVCPELESIILFMRVVLKSDSRNNIKPDQGQTREIDYLANKIETFRLLSICKDLLGDNDGAKMHSFIERGSKLSSTQWAEIMSIATRWLKPYRKMGRFHVFIRHVFYKQYIKITNRCNTRFGTSFINQKTLFNGGVSICFLGQDGSGKSTISKDIQQWLAWKVAAKSFYLGSGGLYKNKSKPKKKNESSKKTCESSNMEYSFRSFYHSLRHAYILMYTAKRAYANILKAKNYIDCGAIAIFDRFPQNQFPGINDGPKIQSLLISKGHDNFFIKVMDLLERHYLFRAQKYQPSLVFKLILTPEASILRRPYEDINVIRQKHNIVKKLEFETSEVHIINAEDNYANEVLTIKRLVWAHILKMQL